jgi:ribose transport system permease protein
MSVVRRLLPLLLVIGLLLAGFRGKVDSFLEVENLLNLTEQISVNAILAFGMTLVILVGGIDLSVGATLALVGVVVAATLPHAGLAGALAAGMGAGLTVGAVNGAVIATTRVPPFIVTLATMLVVRGLALGFNEGRPQSIPDEQATLLFLGNGRLGGWLPMPAVLMLAALAVFVVLLHLSRVGQHLFAIGGNREAARFAGIPVRRSELLVYVASGAAAGLAGIIHVAQLGAAEPASAEGFELNAIAATVVGGTSFSGGIGTIPGTLLGAIVIGTLDKGLNQAGVHFSLQRIVKGLVILGAVLLDTRRRR